MQIILCGPFDDDEPIPYGRCSCSYACGSRERVRGDASLVEMCASLSAPPRLYLLFYLQSKKTISSNILLKYNTSYAKNKWLSYVILAFFYCTEAASYPQFFPQVPKQNWGLLYLSTELSKAQRVPHRLWKKLSTALWIIVKIWLFRF